MAGLTHPGDAAGIWRERAAVCLKLAETADDPGSRRYLKVAERLDELEGYLAPNASCANG